MCQIVALFGQFLHFCIFFWFSLFSLPYEKIWIYLSRIVLKNVQYHYFINNNEMKLITRIKMVLIICIKIYRWIYCLPCRSSFLNIDWRTPFIGSHCSSMSDVSCMVEDDDMARYDEISFREYHFWLRIWQWRIPIIYQHIQGAQDNVAHLFQSEFLVI